MAMKKAVPTVRLRRLASELARYREQADLTREEVSSRTGINTATLYNIEKAVSRPQARTLVALLDAYDVKDEASRNELIRLAKESSQAGWLQPFKDELPEALTAYLSFEQDARFLKWYESLFIPGLLQTERYARAVIAGATPVADDDYVESRVQARMQRKRVLEGPDPLRLWVVVDEAAITREAGGRDVMVEQLDHLAAMAKLPNITLQVVTFDKGAHSGMPGSFVMMDFDDPYPQLIHIESMAGNLFLEKDEELRRFESIFTHLVADAKSPDDSARHVRTVMGRMKARRTTSDESR